MWAWRHCALRRDDFERAAHTAHPRPPPQALPSALGLLWGGDGDDGSSREEHQSRGVFPRWTAVGDRRGSLHTTPRTPTLEDLFSGLCQPIFMSHSRSQPADMLPVPIRRGSSRHQLDLLSARAANLNRSLLSAASTSQSPRFCATIPPPLFIAPLRLLSSRQFQRRHQRCADLSFRSPETGHADPGPGRPLLA